MKQTKDGTLYMGIDDVLSVIRDLSHSQGFYGRLLRDLMEIKASDKKAWRNVIKYFEGAKLKTPLDVVLFIEQ